MIFMVVIPGKGELSVQLEGCTIDLKQNVQFGCWGSEDQILAMI